MYCRRHEEDVDLIFKADCLIYNPKILLKLTVSIKLKEILEKLNI